MAPGGICRSDGRTMQCGIREDDPRGSAGCLFRFHGTKRYPSEKFLSLTFFLRLVYLILENFDFELWVLFVCALVGHIRNYYE